MELTLDQALQKGVEAHKAGKAQEADRYYTAILKANPKHPDANHNMGVLAVGVGKVEAALPFFKTALEINPNIEQFWLSYIDALIQLDQIADAKAVLARAKVNSAKPDSFDQIEKRIGPATSQNPNAQGLPKEKLNALIKLYNQNKLPQVFKEAQKLTKRYSKNLDLWNFMGASAAQIGQLDEAALAFKKAISLEPSYADAHNNIGNVLKDQGKFAEAMEAYTKALLIKPDYAEAYYNIGVTLQKQSKFEEATEAYTKAIALKPDDADAHTNIGVALKEQGKLDEAMEAYTKALSIKPDYAEAYNNMGSVLKDQGKLDEAIIAYTKALSIKPDYAEAYNNMGNVLKDQGKLDEAMEAYTKSINLKPDDADAHTNIGVALKEQGKLEEAMEAYTKALSIKPDHAEAYNNMGNVLKDQGKLDEAIAAYNKAITLKPYHAEINEAICELQTQLSETIIMHETKNRQFNTPNANLLNRPKYQIFQAIYAWLKGDEIRVIGHLADFNSCDPQSFINLTDKDQIFCSAYSHFLGKLIDTPLLKEATVASHQVLYHLGESHCLSYAHKRIKINGADYTVSPRITFGGKAYHFSTEKENSFKAITKVNFDSLPNGSKVFVSFGEIDCRPNEGFISAATKNNKSIEEYIDNTVIGYLAWFSKQNQNKNHDLFFLNVPAPNYDERYTVDVNKKVKSTIKLFNSLLSKTVLDYNLNLIDVYKFTVGHDEFSNGSFHIDKRHLSSFAIPEIEKQIYI